MKRVYATVHKSGVKILKSMLTQKILKWIEESIDEYVYISALPSLFLVEKGTIEVYDYSGLSLSFDDLFKIFSKEDPFLLSKYIVFRDLALKGFYIKDISKDDLLIFEIKKQPNEYPRFIIILEEGRVLSIEIIRRILNKVGIGNKSIVACVERRGGVTYYEVSKFGADRNVDQ